MTRHEWDDDDARRLAEVFGSALDAQIRSEEYLVSRGKPSDTLDKMLHARRIRDLDNTKKEN